MFNSRKSYQKAATKSNILFQLTPLQSKQLKEIMLSILDDVVKVCEKHHICYMLSGGTMLGAARHHGFIPWDDDLDLIIPRKECKKFIEMFQKEMGDQYIIQTPQSDQHSNTGIIKIKKKNTTFIEVLDINVPIHKGIFIDIFPLENVPNSLVFRVLHGFIFNVLKFIVMSCSMYQYRHPLIKNFVKNSMIANINYQIKMFLGLLFSFFTPNKWTKIMDAWVSRFMTKNTKFVALPYGRKHYFGEIFRKQCFFPVSEISFEGRICNAPQNWDKYLKNLYGNYMHPLPENKREKHLIVDFDAEKERF